MVTKIHYYFIISNIILVIIKNNPFSYDKIIIALEYGNTTFKQGLLYYVLGEKDIPAHLQHHKNKFMNTVVIVSGDSNVIVTCYRSKNAVKNIKLKPKELRKYLNCA